MKERIVDYLRNQLRELKETSIVTDPRDEVGHAMINAQHYYAEELLERILNGDFIDD